MRTRRNRYENVSTEEEEEELSDDVKEEELSDDVKEEELLDDVKEEEPTDSGSSVKKKRKTKTPSQPNSKRAKKSKKGFSLDQASIEECFEFLDSEDKGFLTQEDLFKTSRMFDVHLDPEQIEEMFIFALKSSSESEQLDFDCFQALLAELNSAS